ncbi:MAG: phosphohydrolase [Pseudomonadota bacterium]
MTAQLELPCTEPQSDWMQLRSGSPFWPTEPRVQDIRIEDIAHSLSQLCRYGGHTSEFYSVAQHSVLVARCVPVEHRLWALLHDAPEAYVVDVPRPLKHQLQGYKEIENRVMVAVCERFGLPPEMPPIVKRIDDRITADEALRLMQPLLPGWQLPEPLNIEVTPWSCSEAKERFLNMFEALI